MDWRDWTSDELRAVLAHEIAHVARGDYVFSLMAQVTLSLHFYHPLVHWFAQRLQLDQELAADAAAVRLVGNRNAYLHALARLALATPPHRRLWLAGRIKRDDYNGGDAAELHLEDAAWADA